MKFGLKFKSIIKKSDQQENDETSDKTSNQISKKSPKKSSDKNSKSSSDKTSNKSSDKTSNKSSDKISKKSSDKSNTKDKGSRKHIRRHKLESLIAPHHYDIPDHPLGLYIEMREGFQVLPSESKSKTHIETSNSPSKSNEVMIQVEKFIRKEDIDELKTSDDPKLSHYGQILKPDDWNKFKLSVSQKFITEARQSLPKYNKDLFEYAQCGDLNKIREFYNKRRDKTSNNNPNNASDNKNIDDDDDENETIWTSRNLSGDTLLHLAADTSSNIDLVKFLVEEIKLDVNAINDAGNTPLMKCIMSRSKSDEKDDIIQYLLNCNTNLEIRNFAGDCLEDMVHDERHDLMIKDYLNRNKTSVLDTMFAANESSDEGFEE